MQDCSNLTTHLRLWLRPLGTVAMTRGTVTE